LLFVKEAEHKEAGLKCNSRNSGQRRKQWWGGVVRQLCRRWYKHPSLLVAVNMETFMSSSILWWRVSDWLGVCSNWRYV